MRVAYIDELEETSKDGIDKKVEKVYYSALVKAVPKSVDSSDPDQKLDQVQVLDVVWLLEYYHIIF